jgi:hypothetical protein
MEYENGEHMNWEIHKQWSSKCLTWNQNAECYSNMMQLKILQFLCTEFLA